MPQLRVYTLTFRAGLHIGRHGIGQEKVLAHIPADTLFSALVSVRQAWQGGGGEWAARFQDHPPFRLTSAFPYAGGVRFFPRPLQMPSGAAEGIDPKRWRKIRYVSEAVLRKLLSGSLPQAWLPAAPGEEPADGLTLQGGTLWLSKDEVGLLPESMRARPDQKPWRPGALLRAVQRRLVWQEITVPRVTVDRLTNAPNIFHTGRIVFAPGCGLWFGAQGLDEPGRAELETLLALLGDSGVGAERSAGYGTFSFSAEAGLLALPDPRPQGAMLLLSRFYPRSAGDAGALTDPRAAYELVYLAGRVQTPGAASQRRRGVHLAAEGSIVAGFAQGCLAEVTPCPEGAESFPHTVYRYGLALGAGLEEGK